MPYAGKCLLVEYLVPDYYILRNLHSLSTVQILQSGSWNCEIISISFEKNTDNLDYTYLHTVTSFRFTWNSVGYVVFTTKTAVLAGLIKANFHIAHYNNFMLLSDNVNKVGLY